MNDFYKILKSLRKDKGIDLEKIHKRTKISLSALRAIEKGHFDQLPHTYSRLFLRAYAVEIGVDPEEALENLEIYLGNKKPTKINENKSFTSQNEHKTSDPKDLKKEENNAKIGARPSLSIRSDITKSAFIIATLIFALYIILSINKEAEASKPLEYVSEFEDEGSISDEMLIENFVIAAETKQALNETPPYSITLTTDQRLWYEIKVDDMIKSEQVLPVGDNHLHRFKDELSIKFNQTQGLNFYFNESTINTIESNIYPVKLIFSIPNKTVLIQQFLPLK